jgi:hypothetical protein
MKKTLPAICLFVILLLLLGACGPKTNAVPATVTAKSAAQATAVSTQETASDTSAMPAPPSNAAGGAPPGSGTGSSNVETALASATGAYTLDGGNATETGQAYTASNTDQSGVYVTNGGVLTLNNVTVTTSGNTSSDENSSFYGLNAGVLAAAGSQVTINGGAISTIGTGANGAFATGSGSSVTLTDVTINATGDGGHGVMVTQGGAVTLNNVVMTTSGAHSAPIATDRGSGVITTTGGSVTTSGQDSPCYYSTGVLTTSGNTCSSTGSEIAVIEGANSIVLVDTTASTSVANKWAIMIYQSMSGDAKGTEGTFTMTGGSLAFTAASGPLFFVTNSTGLITLKGVQVTVAAGMLVEAGGTDRWGTSGSNGGTVIFTADGQTLTGNMVADSLSSLTVTLQNGSALTGAINSEGTAQAVNLTLDASSTWTVTADSYLTSVSDADGISETTITNIIGNGHIVYYDASACPELGGLTYTLTGGGSLQPLK